jgi:hypothetical protein
MQRAHPRITGAQKDTCTHTHALPADAAVIRDKQIPLTIVPANHRDNVSSSVIIQI